LSAANYANRLEKIKKIELIIMKKSDLVYMPSTYEIDLLKEMDSTINCKLLPVIIYSKNKLKSFDGKRKNLLFVGSFDHSPNVDGLIWFINNILPKVLSSNPDLILNIIGSNTPGKINELRNKNINVLGYVKNNILENYYKKSKICIAPLRYGAGVKGKIIEAMYNQIPVITTTIGAEGLPGIEKCIMIEDKPNEFARKLINVYNNEKVLKKLTEKGYNYIMNNFTIDKAKSIISEDFLQDKPISVESKNAC